jgi:hypothetical protein
MSYILHIWERPLPASLAEAGQIHTQLSAEQTVPNPKFVELAKRLTQRHPCITTLDDEDTNAVWSDGPLDGITARAVYGLGIQTDFVNSVVPFVVETANALGLTVYDMQAAEARLPDGSVLTLPGQSPSVFAKTTQSEQLESKSQVIQLLLDGLRPLMEGYGFKMEKSNLRFSKKYKECKQCIGLDADPYGPTYQFDILVYVEPKYDGNMMGVVNSHDEQCWAAVSKFRAHAKAPCPEIAAPKQHGEWQFKAKTITEVNDAVKIITDYLRVAVMPVLSECASFVGIDQYMNSAPIEACPFYRTPTSLLIAYKAKNLNIQKLAQELLLPQQWPLHNITLQLIQAKLDFVLIFP